MDKQKLTPEELEDLIVREVRRNVHCDGFKSIQFHRLAAGQIANVNWAVSVVNYGTAEKADCDDVLREIIARMQQAYDLKD